MFTIDGDAWNFTLETKCEQALPLIETKNATEKKRNVETTSKRCTKYTHENQNVSWAQNVWKRFNICGLPEDITEAHPHQ